MSKITELCIKFNKMWDAIPEPKRFIYFASAALVWSLLIVIAPVAAFLIAAVVLYIRFQRYDA